LDSVGSIFDRFPGEIAAVIVEPVAGNMGMVEPEPGFLQGLRDITRSGDALLVFDEVMTGFRVHPGGAQAKYGVTPDLTALGKVIGGGLPVGAYGGRSDIMEMVAPAGPVYQAGTLSGNPLAMTAGIETLAELREPGVWESLESTGARLANGLAAAATDAGVEVQVGRAGSMFGLFFNGGPVTDWDSAARSDVDKFGRYHKAMLDEGIYLAPSQFEAGFISTAHGAGEIEASLAAAEKVFAKL
jgi:glutamate-1-semialdehyde 2,1-aminomutase